MSALTPEKLAELRRLLDAPPQHITIARDDALALLDAAADKATELLTTPRFKRAHAIIPALQRVKHVPLGGDLLPAALEAIDAIDALEADR